MGNTPTTRSPSPAPMVSGFRVSLGFTLIELLVVIAKGADVNAWDGYETPLDVSDDESVFATLLRKHGGKTGEELKAEGK